MQSNSVLNLANSTWYSDNRDIDVLKDMQWLNDNLFLADNYLIDPPSQKFHANLKKLRAIVINVIEGDRIERNIDFLNQCLKKASFHNKLSSIDDNFVLEAVPHSHSEDAALASIIIKFIDLVSAQQLQKIRRCHLEECRFYFLDKSKNQNKKFCSGKCNNVAKVRRFRKANSRSPHTTH